MPRSFYVTYYLLIVPSLLLGQLIGSVVKDYILGR